MHDLLFYLDSAAVLLLGTRKATSVEEAKWALS